MELGLAACGIFRVLVLNMEAIPAALEAEAILLGLGCHGDYDEGGCSRVSGEREEKRRGEKVKANHDKWVSKHRG